MPIKLFATNPSFALDPPISNEPNTISGRPQNMIHLIPRKTTCKIFILPHFFGLSDPHGLV